MRTELHLKKWRVTEEYREEFSNNKKRIKNEFKTKTGLIIDQVKYGFGNTNDGNTARRLFSNSAVAAEITGVNKDLIEHFSIILRVMSCGMEINISTFQEHVTRTRDLYLLNYSWYNMPSSVHKVLVHGCEIIKFFDLPIGYIH